MVENFTENTKPLWIDTACSHRFSVLNSDLNNIDVVIIGGGITGLTAALNLKQAGKRVAVIDMGRIGHGETGHTSGHLSEVFDIDYGVLADNFGLEGAKLAARSARDAIQKIEENVRAFGIQCGFTRLPGYKFTENEDEVDALERESKAANRAGVRNSFLESAPLPFATKAAFQVENQAQFHVLEYLYRLADEIPGDGSFIFENTRVIDVDEGSICKVHTEHGTVQCSAVIVAANVPILNKFLMHTKIAPYRTYALAAETNSPVAPHGLFWDTAEPYHYVRTQRIADKDFVLIGGKDHKTGQEGHTDLSFQKLEEYARTHFDLKKTSYRWSGQIIEPVDGLAFIGRNPLSENIYVATGYSGTGLTFGTIAGTLLPDIILRRANPLAALYDATRFKPMASAKKFLRENADFPSRMIGDRISPAQDSDLTHLREDEGRIVRVGAKKVAAYRDPKGELHLMSPVCPHMGCYVNWNEAEKSWDCPCHGSRFSPVGQLLNGPAVTDLASEDYDENFAMQAERYDSQSEDGPLGSPLLTMFSCPCKPKSV